jgi:hypothetical protein
MEKICKVYTDNIIFSIILNQKATSKSSVYHPKEKYTIFTIQILCPCQQGF